MMELMLETDVVAFDHEAFKLQLATELGVQVDQLEIDATAGSTRVAIRLRGGSAGEEDQSAALSTLEGFNVSSMAAALGIPIEMIAPAEEQRSSVTTTTSMSVTTTSRCPKGHWVAM
jgi:hypothetical protein